MKEILCRGQISHRQKLEKGPVRGTRETREKQAWLQNSNIDCGNVLGAYTHDIENSVECNTHTHTYRQMSISIIWEIWIKCVDHL